MLPGWFLYAGAFNELPDDELLGGIWGITYVLLPQFLTSVS